ncbi:MAG: DUF3574 domain-containing protein [Planctomycetes bacterium]|nr:DUF3574 domain-containing protein [Planctomycetota bacterium]
MYKSIIACMVAAAALSGCSVSSHSHRNVAYEVVEVEGYGSQTLTQLFLVLDNGKKRISAEDFDLFVEREIVSRFPDGFHIARGDGHWRRSSSNRSQVGDSRVVFIVHDGKADALARIDEIMSRFRDSFGMAMELRVDTPARIR